MANDDDIQGRTEDVHGHHTSYFYADLPPRDLFAAFALAGMLLSDEVARANDHAEHGVWHQRTSNEEFAEASYAQADAMLRAREKPDAN